MAVIGITIILASLSYFLYRGSSQGWTFPLAAFFGEWTSRRCKGQANLSQPNIVVNDEGAQATSVAEEKDVDKAHMSLRSRPNPQRPSIQAPEPALNVSGSSPSGTQYRDSENGFIERRIQPAVTNGSPSPAAAQPRPASLSAPTQMLPPPRPRPSSNSLLRAPVGSTAAPNGRLLAATSSTRPASKSRKPVVLSPGHSPLDWARLQQSGADLRNLPHANLIRVPPSLLRKHNKRGDAWSTLGGKVYNITPYLPFHPGGEAELMRAAGRDGSALFMEVHPWVSWETMLRECLIGIAVDEEAGGGQRPGDGDAEGGGGNGKWDEMD